MKLSFFFFFLNLHNLLHLINNILNLTFLKSSSNLILQVMEHLGRFLFKHLSISSATSGFRSKADPIPRRILYDFGQPILISKVRKSLIICSQAFSAFTEQNVPI